MTPPAPGDWIDYQSMSLQMRRWFDDNIHLYELDCLFGLPPIKIYIHDWLFKSPPESVPAKAWDIFKNNIPPLVPATHDPVIEACLKASIVAHAAYAQSGKTATTASASPGFAAIIAATTSIAGNSAATAATAATAAEGYALVASSKANGAISAANIAALAKTQMTPFISLSNEAHLDQQRLVVNSAAATASAASRSADQFDTVARAAPGFAAICAAIATRDLPIHLDPDSDQSSSEDEELSFWLDKNNIWTIKENPEEQETSIFSIFSIFPKPQRIKRCKQLSGE